jgi:hypothetical protein
MGCACSKQVVDMDISEGFHLLKDGNAWCAVGPEFRDLKRSPAGFRATPQEAVKELCAQLRRAGYPDRSMPRVGAFLVHGE